MICLIPSSACATGGQEKTPPRARTADLRRKSCEHEGWGWIGVMEDEGDGGRHWRHTDRIQEVLKINKAEHYLER